MELDQHDLAELARELAMNIRPKKELLAKFELTDKQFAEIEQIAFFKNMFEEYIRVFEKPFNTAQRIQEISLVYMEKYLPFIAARMKDSREPLASVVEAGKLLARAGGLDNSDKPSVTSAAEKFVITINLGADQIERYEREAVPVEPDRLKAIEIKTSAKGD